MGTGSVLCRGAVIGSSGGAFLLRGGGAPLFGDWEEDLPEVFFLEKEGGLIRGIKILRQAQYRFWIYD